MSTLTILVVGKGGVGKSSTVNSIIGERAVTVSPFQVYADFLVMDCLFGTTLHCSLCTFFLIVGRTKACYCVAY